MNFVKVIPFWAVILFVGMLGYTAVLSNEHQIHLKEAKYNQIVKQVRSN